MAVALVYNQITLFNYCTIVIIAADGPAVVGPMPTITDSLFSLIIFIYVMITFLYLFYGFCWIEPPKLTEEQKKELAKQVEIFWQKFNVHKSYGMLPKKKIPIFFLVASLRR